MTENKEITKIINSYIDSKSYVDDISKGNSLLLNDILSEELKDIPAEEILHFRLARKLAFKQIEDGNEYDVHTLTASMYMFLNMFTYEQLLSPKTLKHPGDESEYNAQIGIERVCDEFGKYCPPQQIDLEKPNMCALQRQLAHFPEATRNRLQKVFDKNIYVYNRIIRVAYSHMLRYKNVPTTVPWWKKIDDMDHFVIKELDKVEDIPDITDYLPKSSGWGSF
jgi:hypothetical protein